MAITTSRVARWATFAAVVATLAMYAYMLTEWAFVGDDAYISFRYAKNFVSGDGLVWNPGSDPVEGYTNVGWVMLTAVGLALGFGAESTSMVLSIGSGLVVLFALCWLSAQRRGWADITIVAAPLLLVCTRSFAAWSTSGLETMAYTALLLVGLLQAETERSEFDERPWRSSLWLTAAVWMRPDGLLFAGVVGLFHAFDAVRGTRSWRSFGVWLAPALLLLGTHEVFRIAYYGDWVPNTFRVKVNGARWEQGWRYLSYAHLTYGVAWWGGLALLPALWRRARVDLLFTACIALHLLYITYVGGDRFELRFLVPVMPMFLWLWVEALRLLTSSLGRVRPVVVMVVAAGLGATLYTGSQQRMGPIKWEIEQIPFIRTFAAQRAERGQKVRDFVEAGHIPADVRLCVGAAGALPYYADVWALDYFGLNDAEIARQEIPHDRRMIPGHEKQASVARIVADRVDMFDASGLLVTSNLKQAAHAWEKSQRKFRRMGVKDELRLVCHRVEGDWLVFATSLSPKAHASRYGHLPDCQEDVEAFGAR